MSRKWEIKREGASESIPVSSADLADTVDDILTRIESLPTKREEEIIVIRGRKVK